MAERAITIYERLKEANLSVGPPKEEIVTSYAMFKADDKPKQAVRKQGGRFHLLNRGGKGPTVDITYNINFLRDEVDIPFEMAMVIIDFEKSTTPYIDPPTIIITRNGDYTTSSFDKEDKKKLDIIMEEFGLEKWKHPD